MFDVLLTLKRILRLLGGDKITKRTVLFPKTEMEFSNGKGVSRFDQGGGIDPSASIYTIGHINTIIYDGVTYKCVTVQDPAHPQQVSCGNVDRENGTGDTGEPFYLTLQKANGHLAIRDLDEVENSVASSTHTLEILDVEETIHPIDPKYLPGVCLPVVELTTVPTAEGAALNAEEYAKMEALNGEPFILKSGIDTARFSALATPIVEGSTIMYVASTTMFTVSINNMNGWYAYVESATA